MDLQFHQFFRNLQLQFGFSAQFYIAQPDIMLQPLKFHSQCRHIIDIFHRIPQNISQHPKHLTDLILLILYRFPIDHIQCIIQKMRRDLSFQRIRLDPLLFLGCLLS